MSTGELMGLPILGLGLWFAFARGRRLAGAVIALAGLAWSFVAVYVVVGHFRHGGSIYYGFYDQIGGSPQGVVRTLFSDPGAVLGALFEGHDIVYLVLLGFPLLFLFLLSPALAAVALPQLLANALSDFRSMTDPRYHSRCRGDPVSHRRDGLRDREAFVGATLARRRGRSGELSRDDASCSDPGRAWSAGRHSVVVRSSSVRSRGGSGRGGRSRSVRCAGHGVQHGGQPSLREAVHLQRAAPGSSRVGRGRPRRSVGR